MKKILVIDDDRDLADTIKSVLEYAGYKVSLSHEGSDGIKKAKEEKPDLILVDIVMPKMDGAEAITRLKAEPATSNIPVIFLSGLASEGDENSDEGINAGGERIRAIAKPFKNEKLVEIVGEALKPSYKT